MTNPIPPFSALPLLKSGPRLNAWGLYGESDQLGTLNRLTPSHIKSSASEIRTGHRIALDWPLDAQADLPFFGRQPFHHTIHGKAPHHVYDDVWTFNTQSSSQWDGFRHYGYQREGLMYGGRKFGEVGSTADGGRGTLGIGNWVKAGGIVGRGVLLDFHRWRVEMGREWDAWSTEGGRIGVEELREVARWQGTEIRFGDVLFVRSGYMVAHEGAGREELVRLRARKPPQFGGVEQTEEMAEWLWSHFSAVAGDQPSWEAWPSPKEWRLHEVMLGGWGMPIGELFYLEELAKHCQEIGRWSFFLSSQPTNVPAGVASPPNAVAIF